MKRAMGDEFMESAFAHTTFHQGLVGNLLVYLECLAAGLALILVYGHGSTSEPVYPSRV
jgi:hypothetical protein